jgi:hypothetical protein
MHFLGNQLLQAYVAKYNVCFYSSLPLFSSASVSDALYVESVLIHFRTLTCIPSLLIIPLDCCPI